MTTSDNGGSKQNGQPILSVHRTTSAAEEAANSGRCLTTVKPSVSESHWKLLPGEGGKFQEAIRSTARQKGAANAAPASIPAFMRLSGRLV